MTALAKPAQITALTDRPARVFWGCHDSLLGPLLMGVTAEGLCRLEFASGYGLGYDLSLWAKDWPGTEFIANSSASASIAAQFRALDAARWSASALALYGTEFQLKVWKTIMQIQPGEVMSYADVAAMVGKPQATRAVGMAVGSNPVSMLVPCHRVIGADGKLSGTRWGEDRKRILLAMEGIKARD
ncbi:MAG: methylated-DNA--[protein]-cysteine S-methyltransferase [Proteobacteria bacterium]|nr:methylated-DNA--[protein]-cysteine S-methyltransferase [Pseudomonadota bacterium]